MNKILNKNIEILLGKGIYNGCLTISDGKLTQVTLNRAQARNLRQRSILVRNDTFI